MTRVQRELSAAVPETAYARPMSGKLLKRAEFLRVSKGRRFFTPAFVLQAARRGSETQDYPARFGLTITKKTGNAVERNRMRRRLREAIKGAVAMDAKPGTDYVIVAQREALARPFAALVRDIEQAVAEINVKLDIPGSPRRQKPGLDKSRRPPPTGSKKIGTGSGQ